VLSSTLEDWRQGRLPSLIRKDYTGRKRKIKENDGRGEFNSDIL
jgi:hypothetical protein